MSDNSDICNTLNIFFSSIDEQLAHFFFVNTDNPLEFLNDRTEIRFELTSATHKYVQDVVSNLSDSSAGYEVIPVAVNRNIFFCQIITEVLNKILITKTFPSK